MFGTLVRYHSVQISPEFFEAFNASVRKTLSAGGPRLYRQSAVLLGMALTVRTIFWIEQIAVSWHLDSLILTLFGEVSWKEVWRVLSHMPSPVWTVFIPCLSSQLFSFTLLPMAHFPAPHLLLISVGWLHLPVTLKCGHLGPNSQSLPL